jgi:LuxR family maltose regulon positive regulatory protein
VTSQLSGKRLAVIKAPAGFGKTSLAAAWCQQLEQGGNAVAWLTIDSDDDEPAIFLFYVSHALQRACEGVGAAAIDLIHESVLINPRAIVSSLINDLADVDEEVYLFLEDYHWVTNPEIHETLAFFLRRAPSHCHVVLTTRAEPPLPLASLRAQNQLLEIDASALRFDLQETRNFLEFETPDTLAPSEAKLLHEKTEGWAAALRIVASTPIRSQ